EKTGIEVVEGAAASDVLPDSEDIVHEQRTGKVSSAAADAVPASSAAAAVLVGIVELLASAADASMSGPHTYREGGGPPHGIRKTSSRWPTNGKKERRQSPTPFSMFMHSRPPLLLLLLLGVHVSNGFYVPGVSPREVRAFYRCRA
ncbi:MAG: hypothetical protein ACPIOQ_41520, partial [Promethearchaeia archaeon]